MSNDKKFFKVISSKFIHYLPDGLGRDDYINSDNGGLLRNIHVGLKKEAFQYPKFNHLYNLKKDAFSVKYRSDGTGRDSYVT